MATVSCDIYSRLYGRYPKTRMFGQRHNSESVTKQRIRMHVYIDVHEFWSQLLVDTYFTYLRTLLQGLT